VTDLDLLTVGRIGVDLYPTKMNTPLADLDTFARYLGGSPANVAVAGARLGLRSAVFTKVGQDPFGDYLIRRLGEFGVSARYVGRDPRLRTPLAFTELFPPDDFPILFYREPKAPDLNIEPGDVDMDVAARVPILWTSATALSREPSRGTVLEMLAARTRDGLTIHDLDYRPSAWPSRATAEEYNREAVRYASVVVGNLTETSVVVGEGTAEAMAGRLLELGVRLAVVKCGPDGVYARTVDEVVHLPGLRVEVVNGLGAGDAFGGALCAGLLRGLPLAETIALANAAGAHVATQVACADAMPTEEQIRAVLRGSEGEKSEEESSQR
jgi:5-dehydro-2-deoxygluconokinase